MGMDENRFAPYFSASWRGGALSDFEVRDSDGWLVQLYSCQFCASLTTDPQGHVDWHKGVTS